MNAPLSSLLGCHMRHLRLSRCSLRSVATRVAGCICMIILLLGAAACSRQQKYHIGVSQCSYDDWRLKLNDEIRREALLFDDIDVEIVSAYDDPNRQVEDIKRFIRQGKDVIIASPQNDHNLNQVLADARKRGIKVIVFDRDASEKCYDLFIGADNQKLGRAAADYLLSRTGGKGYFLEIIGAESSTPSAGRHAGFTEALAAAPDATLLASASGEWDDDHALRTADSLLRIYPQTNAIYAHNDRMAIAARAAADALGLDHILIAGADAVPEVGIQAVANGTIDATFMYPTAGKEIVDLGRQAAMGHQLRDKVILSSALPVDRSNAEILLQLAQSIEDEKGKISFLKNRVDDFHRRHTEQRVLLLSIASACVLLAIVVFLVLRAFWLRKRNQALLISKNEQLVQQRDELSLLNKRLEEATMAKLSFYTNVSHDLRTPLTLISEPVNQLAQASNLTPDQKALATLANKNVKILMRLINQILDFRKFENGKLSIAPAEINIKSSFADWTSAFRPLAAKHHIHLSLNFGQLDAPSVALDPEKMERILFNLLSNAFKFTPDHGSIEVNVALANGLFQLSVKDSGRGIPTDKLPLVFDRFYQTDKVDPRGSGIGLSLVKAFVNLHQGEVSVKSELGHGATFSVVIPERHIEASSGSDAAEGNSPALKPTEASLLKEMQTLTTSPFPDSDETLIELDPDRPTLLLIDDIDDMRAMLRTILHNDYNIIEAANGRQGVMMAAKYLPDLVISDVMMPEMDGMECCRRIKNEISTSHIPVMLLTACSLDEQHTDGFEAGADAYLAKPFNAELLKAQCRSIIANRRRILNSDVAANSLPDSPDSATHPADALLKNAGKQKGKAEQEKNRKIARTAEVASSELYQRFIALIDEEMANPDISIEEIGARLGFSRVQFYRKIKAATNFSPLEILRARRLRHARRLLTQSDCTIAEVAYSVGFSSPGYFSKCFKEEFGELPLELQKRTSKL